MILMNLKVDNFYGFNDFEINCSYPRKIKGSTILYEYLEEKPNFRYKKVNVIMGANATGKTIFGMVLKNIIWFLVYKEKEELIKMVNNSNKIASFEIDLVLEDLNLYRISCTINNGEIQDLILKKSKITKISSYEDCVNKYKVIEEYCKVKENDPKLKIYKTLKEIENLFSEYLFAFPDEKIEEIYNIKLLNLILKTFDPSIKKVVESEEVENTYHIVFNSGKKVIVQDGEILKSSLSRGTEEGIEIAAILNSIGKKRGLFFIDEKISYVHSELEMEILNQMINLMKPKSQLFFTTHNTDILEMNLPIHSFTF
ncbi:MAG: ATP-binding protein, partial [Psychrilyobacter sp.]|nr:ATP-binding protein [Psychrilyobacter sp.]